MANKTFNHRQSAPKLVTDVFAKITFGGTGAPTLSTLSSLGIKSVSRTSAGLYVITFGTPSVQPTFDTYTKLFMVNHRFISATAPASPAMYIVTDASATTGQITLQFNAAGSATDPGDGEVVLLEFTMGNSTSI